jgi:hypothetical protein
MKRHQTRNMRIGQKIEYFEHKVLAKLMTGGHMCYYSLVAAEAHGTYRYAAGFVGTLVILETVVGVLTHVPTPTE